MAANWCSCSDWSERGKGLAIAVTAVLILSPDTLLIRLPDMDPWDLNFYRFLFFFMPITVFIIYRSGFIGLFREMKVLGWLGLVAATIYALGGTCFTLATITVGSANTLVCVAAAPMFAAIISIVVLKEYPRRITWIAIFVALCAVGVVVGSGLSTENWYGNLYALCASLTQALYIVIARFANKTKNADILPSLVIAGPMAMILSLCVGAEPGRVDASSADFGYVVLQGFLSSLSFSLLTIAAAYISAPETSLTFLLETVLGPIWVFLVLDEEPTIYTLIGGIILILNLAIHNTWALYLDRKAASAEGNGTGSVEDKNNSDSTQRQDQDEQRDTISEASSEEIKSGLEEATNNNNSTMPESPCEIIQVV
uniref:EamA domain-containing protein n=1 Tax=Aplanochytrium stocchinoi TaxID=215587 RepID=A0A7S3UYX1_9STRA|mmetsp:Transcript_13690/g.15902  ORF Transcript_13690/g.15902 Transcript_13690/m.15902 type:complete len:369 (+) Transcript_13690:172-1278(+)|eukprot:CAMPEP_0204829358 /NCGR_PEP_ID=MMETSP1346-20131115/7479_1 /ASSEMBLY_ACC=CAM_ASM_000771 /TAXON_ID=215587 /ORGANISM="Aplanochytrium stocchinoi, Strain GSBS06" /LENGTH=368 /DNA_ID=CAMNT_0051959073 /DNA_START=107 /DNA_END=1213 /DNA_ORIENTATION=-